MICGALQTLNEEAFEDVVGSERPSPSPTGQPGEMMNSTLLQHQLAPIRESVEYSSFVDMDGASSHNTNNNSSNLSHHHSHHTPHGYALLDHHHQAPLLYANHLHNNSHHQQQQPHQPHYHQHTLNQYHLDNVHNESMTGGVGHDNTHYPLPTVIVMPSSTIDDTPL